MKSRAATAMMPMHQQVTPGARMTMYLDVNELDIYVLIMNIGKCFMLRVCVHKSPARYEPSHDVAD